MEISPVQIAGGVGVAAFLTAAKFLFEMRRTVDDYRDGVIWSKAYQEDQEERCRLAFERIGREYTPICHHIKLKGQVDAIRVHQTGRLLPDTTAISREDVQ